MTNSRRKGKEGELELARILRDNGFMCVRGQQKVGRGKNAAIGDDDVIGLPDVHIECKRVERLDLDAAMEQSSRDAAADCTRPVVMHRKNASRRKGDMRGEWKVTMFLDDWLDMYSAYLQAEKEKRRPGTSRQENAVV